MTKTHNEYKELLNDYKGCPQGNEIKVLINLIALMLKIQMDTREVLRDIRSELSGSRNSEIEE